MLQLPVAVGLKLCQQAIVEETTRNVTLVNCFRRLRFSVFPSPPSPMTVCAMLTNGLGEMNLKVEVQSLANLAVVGDRSLKARLENPLKQFMMLLRLPDCIFPFPGRYEATLAAEGEILAFCHIQVALKENP